MPVMLSLALLLAASADPQATGAVGYYRFPAIHGDVIVFGAEGDLWQVARSGGVASRLTSHPADESDPAISPDGTTLAFSAAYESPTEVYTMPLAGGSPVRRTFDGGGARVVGFAPDGALVYSTGRYSTLPDAQLAWLTGSNVLVDNGIATAAEFGVYGPEGQWLIEGHGVEPDIVVDNLPRATFDGKDEQLDAAIRHLEDRIREAPVKDLPPPTFPRKAVE